MEILQNPLFQAVAAPLLASLAVAALLRPVLGARQATALGLGVAAGFLTAYILMEGLPPFPPPASKQKLFWLVAFGGAAGLILDLAGAGRRWRWAALIVLPLGGLVWYAWRQLGAGPEAGLLLSLGLLAAGAIVFLGALEIAGERDGPLAACVPMVVSGAAASGVALLGSSISLALLGAALAAAAGAAAAWLYLGLLTGRGEGGYGATLLLAGSAPLVALSGVLGLYTPQLSRPALALLALVPVAGALAGGWLRRRGGGDLRLAPLLQGLAAAVPAVLALAVAWFGAEPAAAYGY